MRHANGHYKKRIIHTIAAFLVVAGLGYMYRENISVAWQRWTERNSYTEYMSTEIIPDAKADSAVVEEQVAAVLAGKMRRLEDDILYQLATCESGSIKEQDAVRPRSPRRPPAALRSSSLLAAVD